MILVLLACTSEPQPPPTPATTPIENLDQGQQHPPLPADNPAWEWDAGGFVGDFGWYGEHSWADVRMRVAGHLSAAGRDLARLKASRGDLAGAAAAYRSLSDILAAIPTPDDGIAAEINALLLAAAQRDAATLAALAAGQPPSAGSGLSGLRSQYYALAQRHAAGEDVSADAAALQEALKPYLEPRPDLDLDSFTDFSARHALRVRLFEAYLDSLDPLGISERWGYWEADEIARQALLIGAAAGALGGKPWSSLAEEALVGTVTPPGELLRHPSELADALVSRDQVPAYTAEGLGWLPTGDSLIDLAGHPGPRAIGTLQKLGLDDPGHRAWLDATAATLSAADAEGAVAAGREAIAWLDGHSHGSRFYNVKQARNDVVRQLARGGDFALAASVLSDNLPLHNQDWACPNRTGILSAIEGRLLAEAGDAQAEAVLQRALAEGQAFLSDVDRAEAQPGYGLKPPGMSGGHRGKSGTPGANGPPGLPPGGSAGSPEGVRPPGHPPGQRPGGSSPGSGQQQPGHR